MLWWQWPHGELNKVLIYCCEVWTDIFAHFGCWIGHFTSLGVNRLKSFNFDVLRKQALSFYLGNNFALHCTFYQANKRCHFLEQKLFAFSFKVFLLCLRIFAENAIVFVRDCANVTEIPASPFAKCYFPPLTGIRCTCIASNRSHCWYQDNCSIVVR